MRFFAAATVVAYLLSCWGIAVTGPAQQIPSTRVTALDGSTVILPREKSQTPLLVMVGFSRKSSAEFDRWNRRALAPYINDPSIDYYELADFQGVPSFIRSMILHGMRRSVHGAEKAHFAPFTAGEDEWKQAIGYTPAQSTYLLLAEPSGHIVWKTGGVPDDATVAAFQQALAALRASHSLHR